MFEIVFLGTSASAPSVKRGLSASLLLHRDQRFLIDCGEGTQRQLLCSGLGFRKLDKILLTHGHLDHILGLGGLVSTFSRWESISRLSLYGGHSALQRVNDLMQVVLRGGEADMDLEYVVVRPGTIWSSAVLTVTAFPVSHRGPGCFGYLFEERSHRPFLAEEAERLGVPPGPERKLLVSGQPITLADGTTVRPEQVLGAEVKGTRLAYVGDAGRVDDLVGVCRNVDALVIEATYTADEVDMAARFGHLTAAQAARLAAEAQVGHLFLVHISRRHAEREILREAEAIFPHTTVPRDLESYRITRDKVEQVELTDGA
jgi:ribonuclease Z